VHVDSFLARTDDGFYDSLLFFRVIKDFMIQSGDPNNNGTGGAGYNLKAEFNKLPHVEGTLSMARGYAENSAGTQFFVCLARNPKTEYLDGKYTVFGQLLKGFDVLQKIGSVPVKAQPHGEVSRPVDPVYLIKVYRSDTKGNPL
jgi:peptidyl-prolyl cis-trans isomerase B (cyclophilin B)